MNNKELIDTAKDTLSRVLGFFPRVDAMLSVLLALNLALLGVLATNAPAAPKMDFYSTAGAMVFGIFASITFFHLYKSAFPRLDGGHTSLLYFREIARKTDLTYREEFKKITEESYLEDLIEQTWINSFILKEKYDHLKLAFIFLLLSLVFWLPTVLRFAASNTESFLTK